jgi:hypothetical protein
MTVSLHFEESDGAMLARAVHHFVTCLVGEFGHPAAPAEPVAAGEPVVEDLGNKPKTRGKAKTTPQTIDALPTPATPSADAPALTITEARERMKKFANDGHMDQVAEALSKMGVNKVSDIDPDAKDGPSAALATFIADVDVLVAAKG